jgi:hypothetical protein
MYVSCNKEYSCCLFRPLAHGRDVFPSMLQLRARNRMQQRPTSTAAVVTTSRHEEKSRSMFLGTLHSLLVSAHSVVSAFWCAALIIVCCT